MLLDQAKHLEIPSLPLDKYRWLESKSPEIEEHDFIFRVATPRQLLEMALKAERSARRFFEWVAGTTTDPGWRWGESGACAAACRRSRSAGRPSQRPTPLP